MRSRRIKAISTAVVAFGWLVVIAIGLRGLLSYESAPGAVGAAPETWPSSQVSLAPDRMTIVMLAHPHCPCTRASVSELAAIMAHVQGKAVAYVLFAKPGDSAANWEDTGLRRSAAEIPGVTVLSDPEGAEARRFGAETSGHTVLFSADGRLLFRGGITPSRGHAGDNAGASAIVSLVHNRHSDRPQTFVFGCALPNSPATERNVAAVTSR